MPAPAHADGEANPIVNTATVTAKDDLNPAAPPAASQHQTVLLHPTVSIDKTGPETATAGTAVTYTLVVTNTGDESFASSLVVVSDARCEAPPALVSVNGDGSAASFDPGDQWTYTCTVQTAVGDALVHNTGVVDAQDVHGHHATASDDADTTLTAPIVVLPETLKVANAKLRGPQGCIPTKAASKVVVTGRRIASA